MEQRLSVIALGVKNLKKTRAFYDALGWKVATEKDTDNIIWYNLQSMVLGLYPWDLLAEDATISADRTGPSSMILAYNARSEEEVDAALAEAEAAGAKIIKPAQKVFWGSYSGYFADPDDHLWEVAYNPFAKLGPNGEFQFGARD